MMSAVMSFARRVSRVFHNHELEHAEMERDVALHRQSTAARKSIAVSQRSLRVSAAINETLDSLDRANARRHS